MARASELAINKFYITLNHYCLAHSLRQLFTVRLCIFLKVERLEWTHFLCQPVLQVSNVTLHVPCINLNDSACHASCEMVPAKDVHLEFSMEC